MQQLAVSYLKENLGRIWTDSTGKTKKDNPYLQYDRSLLKCPGKQENGHDSISNGVRKMMVHILKC